MGTIDQPDFPGYKRGKQGIAPAETKLSFVKPSIILYCPHLVPDASLLAGEIRSQPLPQRIHGSRGGEGELHNSPVPQLCQLCQLTQHRTGPGRPRAVAQGSPEPQDPHPACPRSPRHSTRAVGWEVSPARERFTDTPSLIPNWKQRMPG